MFSWFWQVLFSKLKACVRYFLLFLKDKCISLLVRTKYSQKKFNLQLFFLPTVSQKFILFWATMRYPPPSNFLFRKNNCMYNRDNAHDVTACPDEQSTKRCEPNKPTTNFVKGLQTSITHLMTRSTCHWISNRMRYFFKNIFWSKHFPVTTNCRSRHSRVFLVKPVLKIS